MNTVKARPMNSYTLEELYAHAEPCDEWPRERVQALLDKHGKVEVTAIDVLDCEDIGDEDAIYQACRMVPSVCAAFARRCAEDAIRAAMPTCDDPAWCKWANAWLDGSDRSRESAYAASAAADAASAAADAYAAYAAAYAADASAAYAYAHFAAHFAATYAADAASAAADAASAAADAYAANAADASAATYALRKHRGWLREEIKTKEIQAAASPSCHALVGLAKIVEVDR